MRPNHIGVSRCAARRRRTSAGSARP
jgi:hypothetical protein